MLWKWGLALGGSGTSRRLEGLAVVKMEESLISFDGLGERWKLPPNNDFCRLKMYFTFACVATMNMKYLELLQISQKRLLEEMPGGFCML